MLLKMRRVPQEAFFDTARPFGTPEGLFWHRIQQTPEKGEPTPASSDGGFSPHPKYALMTV